MHYLMDWNSLFLFSLLKDNIFAEFEVFFDQISHHSSAQLSALKERLNDVANASDATLVN